MTTTNDDAICVTCDNTYGWHQRNNPRHQFNPGGMSVKDSLGLKDKRDKESEAVQPKLSPWPFDPVLRQALVDKGVITPDDLRAAENKIAAVTGQVMRHAEPTT